MASGFLGSPMARWPQPHPVPCLSASGEERSRASRPPSEFWPSGRSLTSAPSSVPCTCCLSALLAPPAQPGLPPLLSLLLCVVPSKAVHLTYEPAWQLPPGERPAAPTSATSLSCSRQVMAPEAPLPAPPPRPSASLTLHAPRAPRVPSRVRVLACAGPGVPVGSLQLFLLEEAGPSP